MIISYSEQGTDQWGRDRMAIATASSFGKILSPTGRKSTQAKAYMNVLLAEWFSGNPKPNKSFGSMQNGHDVEPEAREVYEFITGNEVCEVGVVYKNAGRLIACSPDGLLTMHRKGIEIKCPDEHTHIGYLSDDELPLTYTPQVQGSMYVTGYDEWDFMSYHPKYPPLLITVKRDEKYIIKLDQALNEFNAEMNVKRKKLMRFKS